MKRFIYDLHKWAEDIADAADKTGFSSINIIEKILRDPGYSTKNSKHVVLWWYRNKHIAAMSKAMHQVPISMQICLVVEYGRILKGDGQILTKKEFCAKTGYSCALFDSYIRVSKKKLRGILRGYKNDNKKECHFA